MILSINTSTLQFSLALLREDGTLLAEHSVARSKGHFGSLMPALEFLLGGSGCDAGDLSALVVARGPGSFTGLRVGLSAAKGLCHALGVPLIGISSLDALANQIPYTAYQVIAILDSRRDEFFAARFTWNKHGKLVRESADTCLRFSDFPSLCKKPSLFIGNSFENQKAVLREMTGVPVMLAPPYLWNLRASSVGSLGLERFHAGDFDDPQALDPIYLRSPDIRPNPNMSAARAQDMGQAYKCPDVR